MKEYGTLYIIATPIGNLGDISYRAIEILKTVDVLFAEDTRTTKVLLDRCAISKKMFSYNAHATAAHIELNFYW
jgi:16S rRNA (cytidine1402-2'-O)-methyltransferase